MRVEEHERSKSMKSCFPRPSLQQIRHLQKLYTARLKEMSSDAQTELPNSVDKIAFTPIVIQMQNNQWFQIILRK